MSSAYGLGVSRIRGTAAAARVGGARYKIPCSRKCLNLLNKAPIVGSRPRALVRWRYKIS
jgi:hypothetical protein